MNTEIRDQVHALVDQLPPTQLRALEVLLRSMVDPLSRELALAPIDDEPFIDEDRQAIADADEWSKHNAPAPRESVLSDFGLTMADWDTMGKTPLPEQTSKRNG
jgi:hypothetical protein